MKNNLPPPNSEKSPRKPASPVAEEFLRTEYELLNQWAIQGENVSHRIFNFYITILTTVLGGLVLLIQLLSTGIQESLLIASGVCGFLILIGIVFFDGLVSQYIRNILYYFSMKSIRDYFQQYKEVKLSLLGTPLFSIEKEAFSSPMALVKFGIPGGIQLALIAGVNSILVAAALFSLIWGIGGVGFRLAILIISCVVCSLITLIAHVALAVLMTKSNVAQISSSMVAPGELKKDK